MLGGGRTLGFLIFAPQMTTPSSVSRIRKAGLYDFSVEYDLGTRRKTVDFSAPLNKLFIAMDVWVKVKFRLKLPPLENLFVRAMPVYAEAADFKHPVTRCPHHSSPEDITNVNFQFTNHFIRKWIHLSGHKVMSI